MNWELAIKVAFMWFVFITIFGYAIKLLLKNWKWLRENIDKDLGVDNDGNT